MRKALLGIMAAAVILSLEGTTALAAGPGYGRYYVDADGDGVCDNIGTGVGGNFVDADGDGICDNYQSGQCWGRGYGRGYGRGNGYWCGRVR